MTDAEERLRERPMLTESEADEIEEQMRSMEADPAVNKRALRLFMQSPMPCGHAVGDLMTCDSPPFGCSMCLALSAILDDLTTLRREVEELEGCAEESTKRGNRVIELERRVVQAESLARRVLDEYDEAFGHLPTCEMVTSPSGFYGPADGCTCILADPLAVQLRTEKT